VAEGALGIWSRLDVSVLTDEVAPREEKPKPTAQEIRTRRRKRRVIEFSLNACSAFVWSYALLKLFVADVDRWVVDQIAPSATWILDMRFILLLVVLALCSVVIKKRWWWVFLFLVFWPLIVVLWYLPSFVYKRKSWLLTIGVIHVTAAFFSSLRFTLLLLAIGSSSVLVILATDADWSVGAGAICLLLLWLVSLWKTFRYALSPGRFVRGQRAWTEKMLGSKGFWNFVNVEDRVRNAQVERFDREQTNAVITRASFGLTLCRGSQFWAAQLDAYRRSPVSVVFGCVAVLGIFLQTVLTFTFVNLAIFKFDSSQFSADSPSRPSVAVFAYYSFSSSFVSEISALRPRGSVAAIAQVVAGLSTAVVVCLLVIAVIFGVKQSRVDEAATEAIEGMRRKAREFEEKLGREYDTTGEDLFQRLCDFNSFFAKWLVYLSDQLPGTPSTDRSHGPPS
jgi:hypothetical protein